MPVTSVLPTFPNTKRATMARKDTFAFTTIVAISLALGLILQAQASNWPRFRGPNGTGISEDKEVPIQWSEKGGVLWKTPIPGAGHSSPVVWGGRVFVQSATSDGKERLLLCIDAADGKVLWSRAAPGATAHTHSKNSLSSS